MENQTVQRMAAVLALAAGSIHLYVMPEHFEEYWPFGLFFFVVGGLQIAGSVALAICRSLSLYHLGLAGTLAVIGIYIASRIAGLPSGPHSGEVEAVGLIDLVSKAVEVALVLCLSLLIWRQYNPPRRRAD